MNYWTKNLHCDVKSNSFNFHIFFRPNGYSIKDEKYSYVLYFEFYSNS